ncbi:MAG: apolipoprotein N-acyltransferase [Chlamydiota bacterium]
MFWLWILCSFLITALGQPARVPLLGVFSAAFGFALFWKAMLCFPAKRDRFLLAFVWFGAVQSIQLSWMASLDYMGPLILFVWMGLLAAMGVQFGILSLFLVPGEKIHFRLLFAIGGCWTLFEWVRLFLLTGFTWNPVGLALTNFSYPLQFAAVFGIYGLSFWVILVNVAALNAFFLQRSKRNAVIWAAFALFPYVFGAVHQSFIEKYIPHSQMLSVALVQTALLPDEKEYLTDRLQTPMPPLEQWERVLNLLKSDAPLDMIVLPESAVALSAYQTYYPLEHVEKIWERRFGKRGLVDFPSLDRPYAEPFLVNRTLQWKVSNAFISQALANHFKAHVIIGFDDHLLSGGKVNAAFHFQPGGQIPERCEKRVLVPVGEYIPLANFRLLSKFVASQFGIGSSFQPGKVAKIFNAAVPLGVSICYEETYTDLIRDLRLKGAELFVNISNDAWFPRSKLAQQHYHHGRIRAVENGVGVIRACNTGVTCAINCFGQTVSKLPESETTESALFLSFPLRSYKTLYTWWGDSAILGLSLLSFLFYVGKKKLL